MPDVHLADPFPHIKVAASLRAGYPAVMVVRAPLIRDLGAPRRMDALGETMRTGAWLDLMRAGDVYARERLIEHSCERLRRLTRRMLGRFPDLGRWETTDDVLQNAMIRLHRCLSQVQPESPRHYYNLAATQVRRELIDLTKHHFGPGGLGANHHTDGDGRSADEWDGAVQAAVEPAGEPGNLDGWSAFHEAVESLTAEEREVVNLLWYEGVTHADAAQILGVSTKTVQRRWLSARIMIQDAMNHEPPG